MNAVQLMTLEEVAQHLRVTRKTIYRLLQSGKIPATRVGRQWRFDRGAIDEWLDGKSSGAKSSILVVDDEATIRELFQDILEGLGHKVAVAGTANKGLEWIKGQDFDLVFLDLKMPGMDGAQLLGQIREIKPKLPVVIITGYPDSQMMAQALTHGPFGIMNKPFGELDIISAVNSFSRVGGV